MPDENGWAEWSKHVLFELERLNNIVINLNAKIESLQEALSKITTNSNDLKDLKKWRHNIDEVASPSQLKLIQTDVNELKIFKAKAIAIWLLLQTLVGIALAILGLKS
jgi:hypothetical protein